MGRPNKPMEAGLRLGGNTAVKLWEALSNVPGRREGASRPGRRPTAHGLAFSATSNEHSLHRKEPVLLPGFKTNDADSAFS